MIVNIDDTIVDALDDRNRANGHINGWLFAAFWNALVKRASIDLQALEASWHMYRPTKPSDE